MSGLYNDGCACIDWAAGLKQLWNTRKTRGRAPGTRRKMDEFDDNELGLPEEINGGADLGDELEPADADIEIDLESVMEPAGRASGGARAGKSAAAPKPAPAAKAAAPKKAAPKKAAPKKAAK